MKDQTQPNQKPAEADIPTITREQMQETRRRLAKADGKPLFQSGTGFGSFFDSADAAPVHGDEQP